MPLARLAVAMLVAGACVLVLAQSAIAAAPVVTGVHGYYQRDVIDGQTHEREDYDIVTWDWNVHSGADPVTLMTITVNSGDEYVPGSQQLTLDGVDMATACATFTPGATQSVCTLDDVAPSTVLRVSRTAQLLFGSESTHGAWLAVDSDGSAHINSGVQATTAWRAYRSDDDPPTCTSSGEFGHDAPKVAFGTPTVELPFTCTDPEGFPVTITPTGTRWWDGNQAPNEWYLPFTPLAAFDGTNVRWSVPPAVATGGGAMFSYSATTPTYPPTGAAGAARDGSYYVDIVVPVQMEVTVAMGPVIGGTVPSTSRNPTYTITVRNTGSTTIPAGVIIEPVTTPANLLYVGGGYSMLEAPLAPGASHTFTETTSSNHAALGSREHRVRVDFMATSRFADGPLIDTPGQPIATTTVSAVPHRPNVRRAPKVMGTVTAGGIARCRPGRFYPAPRTSKVGFYAQGSSESVPGTVVRLHPLTAGMRIACSHDVTTRWGRGIANSAYVTVRAQRRYRGGNGNDAYLGDGRRNVISMGPGRDLASMGGGNDVVDMGPGNDVVLGGKGNDRITCGTGRDQVDAGPGNDTISCRDGTGNDLIICGGGTDTVYADAGDELHGCERRRSRVSIVRSPFAAWL